MPAHAVAADAAHGQRGKVPLHQRGQLLRHVIFHAEMRGPGRLRGVDVKTRALAQVIGRVIRHASAARAGIGRHHDQPVLRRPLLRPGLGDEVLLGAGQPRKPIQNRAFFSRQCRWRQVNAEFHGRARAGAVVLPDFLAAAKTGVLFKALHDGFS